MTPYRDIANGDVCPVDPAHGRMFMLARERAAAVQFCAHASHKDRAVYAYDGITPVAPPTESELRAIHGDR